MLFSRLEVYLFGGEMTEQQPTQKPIRPTAKELQQHIEQLRTQLAEKDKTIEDYTAHLKRLQADFENFMKRAEKEREDLKTAASEKLVMKMLLTLDDFQRAFEQLKNGCTHDDFIKGAQMIFTQFHKTLQDEGVREIPAAGEKFDPYKHEAILQVETEQYPEGLIIEELQKGYMLKSKVIRYAKVKVAKGVKQKTGHKEDKK